MRYILKILQTGTQHTASLYRAGDDVFSLPIKDFDLQPESVVRIKGADYRLQELTEAFHLYDPMEDDRQREIMERVLDEAGQLQLGMFLYDRTFGRLDTDKQEKLFDDDEEGKEIRIMTDDPFLVSLPWILLCRNRSFLFLSWCGIALSHPYAEEGKQAAVNLPALPRILVAHPDPYSNTDWELHIRKIRDNLASYEPQLCTEEHLQTSETWKEFAEKLEQFAPHIVYYFGHAEGDMYSVRFLFNAEGGGEEAVPVLDLAAVLKRIQRERGDGALPVLAYFNCCRGNCGGLAGIGMQLEGMIPAVVTNRTTAFTDTAQEQALVFWEAVLAGRLCPCRALLEVYSRIGSSDTTRESKWLTPVLHANYAAWATAHNGVRHSDLDRYLKLDRKQSHTVVESSIEMLRRFKPRTYAFAWYGGPGQGLELFHRRLELELATIRENYHYLEAAPALPHEINQVDAECLDRMLREMMAVAFRQAVKNRRYTAFEDIKLAIRSVTHGASGKQTLVYIQHHIPLALKSVLNPRTVFSYLRWLDRVFIPMLEPSQFILLGISFEVEKPARFKTIAVNEGLGPRPFPSISFRLLKPLENISAEDIENFLDDHYDNLPAAEQKRIIANVMDKSGGIYQEAIGQLQHELENKHYNPGRDNLHPAGTDMDLDY